LNGEDIKGKGGVPLKNGDIISPAKVFNIQFMCREKSIPKKDAQIS